jgi:hypothetical protein
MQAGEHRLHMPSSDKIARHCDEIERCNQRGGRMLTLPDLLQAGTMDLPMAGYLLAAVSAGQSFMIGCLPGGGGKTTVMGALLNVTPADVELNPADSMATLTEGLHHPEPRRCYIGHEIGAGRYYAYLWGAEARAFFQLTRTGHIVATNLHADTLEQARAQLCAENGVDDRDLERVGLKLFLHVGSGWGERRRRVMAVHESAPGEGHRLLFRWETETDRFVREGSSRLVSEAREAKSRELLFELTQRRGPCTLEVVRHAMLAKQLNGIQ